MLLKIKTAFLMLALFAGLLVAAGEVWAKTDPGDLSNFSGDQKLKEAVWALAAFLPTIDKLAPQSRLLRVPAHNDQPPVLIRLDFETPWALWPTSFSIIFSPDDASHPARLMIEDAGPFGGNNLHLPGPTGTPEQAQKRLLEELTALNARLLQTRPRASFASWQEQRPGLEIGRGKLLYGARGGKPELYMVKIDPSKFDLKPFHEKEFPDEPLVDAEGWAARLPQAALLINGGQFYDDRTYMGLLMRDGQAISDKKHEQWQGFMVSNPKENAPQDAPKAAIIDSNQEPNLYTPEHYQNVAQSFMILDKQGRIRTRNSYNLASRSVIGQDRDGFIWVIMTPAAITLFDLAVVLKDSQWGLEQAMTLDGGFESQLVVRKDENEGLLVTTGQLSVHPSWGPRFSPPGYVHSLPSILAVLPALKAAEELKPGRETGEPATN